MSIQSETSPHDQLLKKLWKSAEAAQYLTNSTTLDPCLVPLIRGLDDEELAIVDSIVTTSSYEDSHPEATVAHHPIRRLFAPFVGMASKALRKRRELTWPDGWAEQHIEQSIRAVDAGAFEVLRDAVAAESKARRSATTL